MRICILALVCLIGLCSVSSATKVKSPPVSPPIVQRSYPWLSDAEYDLVIQVNAWHREQGKSPLIPDQRLTEAARERNQWSANLWNAVRGCAHKPGLMLDCQSHGFRGAVAENLACGQRNCYEATYIAWANSPGHRMNMLGNYRLIGPSVIGHVYLTTLGG